MIVSSWEEILVLSSTARWVIEWLSEWVLVVRPAAEEVGSHNVSKFQDGRTIFFFHVTVGIEWEGRPVPQYPYGTSPVRESAELRFGVGHGISSGSSVRSSVHHGRGWVSPHYLPLKPYDVDDVEKIRFDRSRYNETRAITHTPPSVPRSREE